MKTIVLASAALANDGGYRDAGTEMTVGDKPDQIDAARAKTLMERGFALSLAAAAAAEKAASGDGDAQAAPEPAAG